MRLLTPGPGVPFPGMRSGSSSLPMLSIHPSILLYISAYVVTRPPPHPHHHHHQHRRRRRRTLPRDTRPST